MSKPFDDAVKRYMHSRTGREVAEVEVCFDPAVHWGTLTGWDDADFSITVRYGDKRYPRSNNFSNEDAVALFRNMLAWEDS